MEPHTTGFKPLPEISLFKFLRCAQENICLAKTPMPSHVNFKRKYSSTYLTAFIRRRGFTKAMKRFN